MSARARQPIRVVVAQPDALYRDLLRLALSQTRGIHLLGAYSRPEQLLQDAPTLTPEVAVIDVELGGRNGIQAAQRLQRLVPELGIVLLIDDRDVGIISSMPESAVRRWSYLVNRSTQNLTALLRAIQVTHARLLDIGDVAPAALSPVPGPRASFPSFTARQREILGLVAQGFTNRAIADTLQLKEKTIENQLAAIYGKFDVGGDRSFVHLRVWAALHFHDAEQGREPDAAD